MEFGIVDCHAHIFPPLAGACGFEDAPTHLLHQQRAMHEHRNQPYRRQRDNSIVAERALWSADDSSVAGRHDVGFRVGRCGRFEWEADGEAQFVQFLPPYMTDMSAPAEVMVRQMDYAGIVTAVLQNDHIYGDLADDFAAARARYPGRFMGLAQVQEAWAFRDDQLARLVDQVERLGMAGLYFTYSGLFRNGYATRPSDPAYDPLWREVTRLDLPVFWVHRDKSPIGSYEEELGDLEHILQRHPTIRSVLVHGLPTLRYADATERLTLPPVVERLLTRMPVWAELLYPISWGGRFEYPYGKAMVHFHQLVDRFGSARFVWGSDMPNVERYCTYRQTLTYVWDHVDFLTDADRRAIFRDNTLAVIARSEATKRDCPDGVDDPLAASACHSTGCQNL
jgi:predicted TIM-barrel fold metal-dependent hydrolase